MFDSHSYTARQRVAVGNLRLCFARIFLADTLSQQNDPMRFKALQRAIPDISQKMLTSTLRTLEQDGFIVRKAYAEVPPRVEYQSTERAASLMPHLNALFGWAIDHMQSILRDREVYTAKGNES